MVQSFPLRLAFPEYQLHCVFFHSLSDSFLSRAEFSTSCLIRKIQHSPQEPGTQSQTQLRPQPEGLHNSCRLTSNLVPRSIMSFSCRTQPPVMITGITGGGVTRRKRHYGPGIEVD